MGRQLARLLGEAGLTEVEMTGHSMFIEPVDLVQTVFAGNLANAVTEGRMTEAEVATWWQQMEGAAAAAPLTVAITLFVASGTKP
jgi:hypothetical protein